MELDNMQIENIQELVTVSGIGREELVRLLFDISEEISGEIGELVLDLAYIIKE